MRKFLCAALSFALILICSVNAYAAGPQDPIINSEMPDCYGTVGESSIVLYTDASSPDGGTLEYQWYSTTENDIATIRAIDDATGASFATPNTSIGVMYYCYAVWNTKSGAKSSPVYSRLIRVEYSEGEFTVESIEILSTPDKVVYTSGECLDLTGLRVRIWTSDGYIDSVNGDKLEITENPLVTEGEQKIKVSYKGVYDFFIITVKPGEHTHSFGDWVIVTEPSCTEDGVKVRECDCGRTEREGIPATGHSWDEGRITKEPAEDSDGEITYTCTVCNETKSEVIKAGESTTPSATAPGSVSVQPSSGFPWWIVVIIVIAIIAIGIGIT
ncbi:MAG: bacterial Ig-like domain-containing protein, partial [Firmicutes bacterium]|nr:bacterial Ig-like domain-containing protein [Bacillota bacterium]